MADHVTSPRTSLSIPRKPVRSPPQPPYYDQDEQKENIVRRKPLGNITIPPSARMHDAPMSPVKINVQSEEWAPRPSSAQVEGYNVPTGNIRVDSEAQQAQQRANNGSEQAILQDMPNRQNYTTHAAEPVLQPQVALLTSSNTTNSFYTNSDNSLYNENQPITTPSPSSNTGDSLTEISTEIPAVQPLQYHHQPQFPIDPYTSAAEQGRDINRHLTPSSLHGRRSAILRPASGYSGLSDPDGRGRSPGHNTNSPGYQGRSPSANLPGRSPDGRPMSYVDLLSVPYPQPPPPPVSFDNSQLRSAVGSNASLLSTAKTLEMYRMNVKKTNDPEIQYAFAVFLISAAQEAGLAESASPTRENQYVERLDSPSSAQDLLREARQLLSKLADRSYPFAQYYLADGYASGLFNKGKEDYDRAFPLFVAASKHGHAESGYRAALCYEFGWGCRKDPAKAVQFYRQSASKNHPGAMTRLGRACLSGDLGLNKYREGIKWLKRATEAADPQYNTAPYHLGLMYETGYGDDIFKDETYAAQLFTQAADLGHAEASYKLGDAYEHGKLSCPIDAALSVHFYTNAAQGGHSAAMMALCAWYMVGAEPVLEKDENEAYEWARRAAELGKLSAVVISLSIQ
jgi:TPR repeat protein